jgi:hypothetical protein
LATLHHGQKLTNAGKQFGGFSSKLQLILCLRGTTLKTQKMTVGQVGVGLHPDSMQPVVCLFLPIASDMWTKPSPQHFAGSAETSHIRYGSTSQTGSLYWNSHQPT